MFLVYSLYGVALHQTYQYYATFADDSRRLKIYVSISLTSMSVPQINCLTRLLS